MKDTCVPISKLLMLEVRVNDDGVSYLYGRLEPTNRETAAMSLACSIVRRRLFNYRLFQSWHQRAKGEITDALDSSGGAVIRAAVLENVGSPVKPSPNEHLFGLVAEGIWQCVVSDEDAGLGTPIRVEGHDWSVTDPGGDGLTVYGSDGQYCFRLWESKYHGSSGALKDTVNGACRQVNERALSYLTRFSFVAQYLSDDEQLAAFYGRLSELWADKDLAAGVGIVVGADSSREEAGDGYFDRMTTYFQLPADQHQGQLNFVDGFQTFAESVRRILWKGCGLWTGI